MRKEARFLTIILYTISAAMYTAVFLQQTYASSNDKLFNANIKFLTSQNAHKRIDLSFFLFLKAGAHRWSIYTTKSRIRLHKPIAEGKLDKIPIAKKYDILGNYGIDKQRSSLDSAKLINLNRLSLQNDKTLALTYCFALSHHFTLDIVSYL
jgi:hypothetical protein